MATIPIRDVPGEAVNPTGDELILIDNGIQMQRATINDAVAPEAGRIADAKIAELNLGSASQNNTEDFATAAQGLLADSAVQPTREIIAGDGLTGGGNLSEDRTISLNSASIASLAKADTAVQSVVAGANVTVDATDPQNPIISASGGGGAASADFATVADLLADNNGKIGYAGSGADTEVLPGDIVTAQGFRYEVAASDATDAHVETAGGVKLYVVEEILRPEMFGVVDLTGTTSVHGIFQTMASIGRPVIVAVPGRYLLDNQVTLQNGFDWQLSSGVTIVNGINDPRGTTKALFAGSGSATTVANLTSQINLHDQTAVVDTVDNIQVGDLLSFMNDYDPSPFPQFRAYVTDISGTTLTLDRPAVTVSPTGSVVQKITPITGTFEGGGCTFDFNGTTASPRYGFGILLTNVAGAIIRDIKGRNIGSKMIEVARCNDNLVENIECIGGTDTGGTGGHSYVVRCSIGSGNTFVNIKGSGVRHMVDFSAASGNYVYRSVGRNNASADFLTHFNGCRGNIFYDCESYNNGTAAFSFQPGSGDLDNKVINPKIVNSEPLRNPDNLIGGNEIIGGEILFTTSKEAIGFTGKFSRTKITAQTAIRQSPDMPQEFVDCEFHVSTRLVNAGAGAKTSPILFVGGKCFDGLGNRLFQGVVGPVRAELIDFTVYSLAGGLGNDNCMFYDKFNAVLNNVKTYGSQKLTVGLYLGGNDHVSTIDARDCDFRTENRISRRSGAETTGTCVVTADIDTLKKCPVFNATSVTKIYSADEISVSGLAAAPAGAVVGGVPIFDASGSLLGRVEVKAP